MGMSGHFFTIDEKEQKEIQENPDCLPEKAFDKSEVAYETSNYENFLDIDQTWMGIHFLLTGDAAGGAFPLGNVIYGVKSIHLSEEEIFNLSSPDEVRAIAAALSEISEADIISNYDPGTMKEMEIYPDLGNDEKSDLEYILPYFEELQEFYKKAASKKLGMITYVR